jgi:hypothetical protein
MLGFCAFSRQEATPVCAGFGRRSDRSPPVCHGKAALIGEADAPGQNRASIQRVPQIDGRLAAAGRFHPV